jgi:hypothetical protein
MAIEVRESRGVYLISGELALVSAEQFRHWMEPTLDATGEIVSRPGRRDVHRLGRITVNHTVGQNDRRSWDRLALSAGPGASGPGAAYIEEIPGIRIERW